MKGPPRSGSYTRPIPAEPLSPFTQPPVAHHAADGTSARVVRAHVGVFERIATVWRYRELLVGMTRRELKVKYKNSALGFAWSMLNPLMIMVVYYFAFEVVLHAGIPQFPFFLLSGVLVWNLFSGGMSAATVSMVQNSALVKKVSFPREILPLASVGAAAVHFFLQGLVLLVAMAAFRHNVAWTYMPFLIPATIVITMFAAAFGVLLSAVNAYLRDTQHIVDLLLVAWFWGTPIVYAYGTVQPHLHRRWAEILYFLNPVTAIALTFQRALYAKLRTGPTPLLPGWGPAVYAEMLGAGLVISLAFFAIALRVFGRLEGNIAEEL